MLFYLKNTYSRYNYLYPFWHSGGGLVKVEWHVQDYLHLKWHVELRRLATPAVDGNAAYYCTFLQHHLHPALRRKRLHLVVQNPIILHDNEGSHTTAAVTDFFRLWEWGILQLPPYSPDMGPCDYDLFAKVKEPLRGTRYNTRDELTRALERSIETSRKMDTYTPTHTHSHKHLLLYNNTSKIYMLYTVSFLCKYNRFNILCLYKIYTVL